MLAVLTRQQTAEPPASKAPYRPMLDRDEARGARFLLTLPLTALGVTGLAGFVLFAYPPTEASEWPGIAFLGVVAALMALTDTCLVVVDRSIIRVVRLVGSRVVERAHAHLSFRPHHGTGGIVTVHLLLHQAPSGKPVAMTSFTSIGYPRAARRARWLAQMLADSFHLSWSEDGLEAREFKEALAAQSRRTVQSVALLLATWMSAALVIGLLGWWYFTR